MQHRQAQQWVPLILHKYAQTYFLLDAACAAIALLASHAQSGVSLSLCKMGHPVVEAVPSHSSPKLDADKRDIQILPIVILTCNHHIYITFPRWNVPLSHSLNEFRQLPSQAILVLDEYVIVQ